MSIGLPNLFEPLNPKYFSYTALVMANRLAEAVEKNAFDPENIPTGVYQEAKILFRAAMDSVRRGSPVEAGASWASFELAREIVMNIDPSLDASAINRFLDRLDLTNQGLAVKRNLGESDARQFGELERFFRVLHELGSRRAYADFMAASHPALPTTEPGSER